MPISKVFIYREMWLLNNSANKYFKSSFNVTKTGRINDNHRISESKLEKSITELNNYILEKSQSIVVLFGRQRNKILS